MSDTESFTPDRNATDEDELNWTSVAEVGKEAEAAVVAGFLKSQGIPAVVDSEKFHQAPVNFGDLAQISIMVPAGQEQRALEILASQTVSEESDATDAIDETDAAKTPSNHDA